MISFQEAIGAAPTKSSLLGGKEMRLKKVIEERHSA
jgi:hypothetical protein